MKDREIKTQEERRNKEGLTRRELLSRMIVLGVCAALEKFAFACSPPLTPEAPIDQSKVYNFENFLEILKNNNLIDEEVYPFISESSRVPVLVKTPEGKSILTFSERSFRELVEKRIKLVIKAYEDLAEGQGDLVILDIPPNLRNLLNLDFYEMDIVLLRVKISENEYLLFPINFLKKEILDRLSDESKIKALPTIQIDEEASLRAIGQIVEKNDLGFRINREEIIDGTDLARNRELNRKLLNENIKIYTKSSNLVPGEASWARLLELRKDYPNLDGSTHFIFFYNEQGECIRALKISSSRLTDGVRVNLSKVDWHAHLRHDLDHLISGLMGSIPEKVIRDQKLIREIFQHFSENPNQPFVIKIGPNQTIKFEVPHEKCIRKATTSQGTSLIYSIRGFLKIETEGGKRFAIYPAELYRLEGDIFYGFLNIGPVTSFTGLNARAHLLKRRWALDDIDIEAIPYLSGLRKTGSFSEFFKILRNLGKSPLAAVGRNVQKIPRGITNVLDGVGSILTIYTAKVNFDKQQKARQILNTFPENIRKKLEEINLGLDSQNNNWREEWKVYTSFETGILKGGELKSIDLVVIPPYSKRSIIQPETDIIDRWYTESGKLGIFVLEVESEEKLQQDKDTIQRKIYTLVIFNNNPSDPNKSDIYLRYVPLPEVSIIDEIFEFPVSNMYYYNPDFRGGLYFRIYAGVLKGEDGKDRIVIFLITDDFESLPLNLNEIRFQN